MKQKLEFLIHPNFRQDQKREQSINENIAEKKWYQEIEKIFQDPDKILIILATSTIKERKGEKATDQEILNFAEKKLGNRCIILPYIEADIPEYADKLKNELIKRGLIKNEKDLKIFSSSAFGEFAEACVVQIADELNKSLGLDKKTQIQNKKSLSINGEDNREVNSRVRTIINNLNLKNVTVKDRKAA